MKPIVGLPLAPKGIVHSYTMQSLIISNQHL